MRLLLALTASHYFLYPSTRLSRHAAQSKKPELGCWGEGQREKYFNEVKIQIKDEEGKRESK